MTRKLYLVLLLTGISYLLEGANENFPFGGRQAGMANAAVSLHDFWAISHNQAGLANITEVTAGFYFENRYLTREMSFGAAALAVPAAGGVLGISTTWFGFSHYHETKTGVTYARAFGSRLSAAVQLNYLYTFIGDNNGRAGILAAEAGMIYELLPRLYVGAHLFNFTQSRLPAVADEPVAAVLRLGASYFFAENLLLSVETEKDINQDPVFKTGIEYQIIQDIYVRAGLGTQPATNAFGFGIKTGNLKIDLASSFHQVLGYSPQVSLLYHFR